MARGGMLAGKAFQKVLAKRAEHLKCTENLIKTNIKSHISMRFGQIV